MLVFIIRNRLSSVVFGCLATAVLTRSAILTINTGVKLRRVLHRNASRNNTFKQNRNRQILKKETRQVFARSRNPRGMIAIARQEKRVIRKNSSQGRRNGSR